MLKNKLQIVLITYNRKPALESTFKQIFAETSPIKNFDITILDNASTDGTSELVKEYCKKFPNLVYHRNPLNIGGNANICRAYEYGANSGKEYVWVLCDDDYLDFSNWNKVEELIMADADLICITKYAIPDNATDLFANTIFQLTFVPAGIYKTKYITSQVIFNMYESIYTMFPQFALISDFVNNNRKIHLLQNSIVVAGRYTGHDIDGGSYLRGVNRKKVSYRKLNTNCLLGYSNVGTLLQDTSLYKRVARTAINCKEVHKNREQFFKSLYILLKSKQKFIYFLEIYSTFDKTLQREIRQKCGIYILFALIIQIFDLIHPIDLLYSFLYFLKKIFIFIIRTIKILIILQ